MKLSRRELFLMCAAGTAAVAVAAMPKREAAYVAVADDPDLTFHFVGQPEMPAADAVQIETFDISQAVDAMVKRWRDEHGIVIGQA